MIPFLNRIRNRFRRAELADELDRELNFHHQQLMRDQIARGMSPADAAHFARREMGNPTSIREESRDVWTFSWLEDPMLDIRHAVRALRRTPVFTLVAALTLALGLGATAAIFTVVNGVLLKPLPYGHPEQLVGAWHDLPPVNMLHTGQTTGTFFTYQKLTHSITGIAAYQQSAANVSDPGGKTEPQRLTASYVSAALIPVLEVPLLRGRNFSPAEDLPNGPRVVIISEGLWRSRFGADPNILNRSLEVNGFAREIIGVMPSTFRFPAPGTELWLPLAMDPLSQNAGGFNFTAVARLKPGITIADAQRDFVATLPHMVELYPFVVPGVPMKMLMEQAKPQPVLVPLKKDVTGGIASTLWIVAAAAGLVLLVACANVTNLILVRVDGRQRELAVREAIGAGRGRVMMHFFAESAVLTGFGAVAGLAMAWVAVRALVSGGPADIPRLAELGIGIDTVVFTAAVALAAAVVCSAIPMLRIGKVDLSNALREGGRSGTSGKARQRVRSALVAAQMALALVVLAGSGLLIRTFQHLNSVKPGFNPERLTTFWMSPSRARYAGDSDVVRFYSELSDRVAQLPGVQSVGLTSRLPLESFGMDQDPYYPEGDSRFDNQLPPLQLFTTVSGDYFRAMNIPIVSGRTFDTFARQNPSEAIISQRTAQYFYHDSTGTSAIGKRFRQMPKGVWYTIVGVAADIRDTSLAQPASQTVYFPEVASLQKEFGQTARMMALVVRSSGDQTGIIAAVQSAVKAIDPTLPTFQIQSMQSVFKSSMAQLTFTMLILGAAAAVTLILGAIGLYGVMAYVVTLRTKELGVRVALGAQPSAVAAMMTRQGLALTGIGLVSGLVLFAIVARFLRSFLVGVSPNDPVALGAASATLLLIAALATWIPARRASRVDPADALRAE